jgi:hypothetical protein
MKRTALLAVAAFLLVAGPATAAPKAIKGVVVAKRAHGTVVVATGRRGLAVTVRAGSRHLRLGDRVRVVGKRLHVISHVRKARIRGMVVKRLAHAIRIASGHSVLTIHTRSRALASHHDGQREGEMGEFEIEFEHGDLVEHGFTAVSASGTVEIEGHLVSVSPLVVSVEGLPIEITVPSGMTLPALTPGEEVELTVQTGAGNVFTLVSIKPGDDENEDENEVEAKGVVTGSTTSQITIDAGGATLTFAAPAGVTLPVIANGTFVEARGVAINGVLTLTRLRTEDDGEGGSGDGGGH